MALSNGLLFGLLADTFDPGSIQDFDGREWGGVRLEDTTRDEFTRRYKTRGGTFIRPEAVIVDLSSRSPWEMQALLDGKNGGSRITGFYLAYRDRMPRLDRFEEGRSAEKFYSRDRLSDWYVAAFPRMGTALLVAGDDDDRVPFALLTTRSRLERILDRMDRDRTRIRRESRERERDENTIEIADVRVNLLTKDLRLRREDSVMSDLRLEATRRINSKAMQYTGRGSNIVYVSVNIIFREGKSGNTITALAQLNGTNGRGKIFASGTGNWPLDKDESKARRYVDIGVPTTVRIAINGLRSEIDKKVSKQKPASPEEERAAAFVQLFDEATK